MLPTVTITTDGSARGNPGPGGWAALLEANGREKLLTGQEAAQTTNNAMELQAVVAALQLLKQPCHVVLRADSEYVLHGLRRILDGGTMQHTKFNRALWVELEALVQRHKLEPIWVRAHNGDARNERVDQAANAAANAAAAGLRGQEARTRSTNDWVIALRSSGGGKRGHWLLHTPHGDLRGTVDGPQATELTNLYRALGVALRVAQQQADHAAATIRIASNLETLVKQGRGEWKVKQPAQQPLAAAVAQLRPAFAEVVFTYQPTAEIEALFNEQEIVNSR